MNTHYYRALRCLLIIGTVLGSITTAYANPLTPKDKPFDQYSWVTTHNSFEKINQHLDEIPKQLNEGVRGFMLDLYPNNSPFDKDKVRICHDTPAGKFCYGPLYNQLANEFLPFLEKNPTEVVTLFLQTSVSRDNLQQVFATLPKLANYSFDPNNFTGPTWPTARQMAQKNNRLIIFTDSRQVAGQYNVNGKTVSVLYDQDWLLQNDWRTLGAMAGGKHDWSCPTRWSSLPLNTNTVASNTGKTWNRLFLMNQFHYATSTTFDSAAKENNLTFMGRLVGNCGRLPNFIGVNNYRSGDVRPYAQALSQGGIYLWEGNNADPAQDAVCVIPRAQRSLKFSSAGCENDEARSMSLSGLDKGTRITLYDSRDGHTDTDHAVIDVKRDIGIHEKIIIPSFERTTNNTHYQMVYNRNNGLDGKVSRIDINVTPTDFSDASVAFYEGTGASQNLDCVIPFGRAYNFKMKSGQFGCSNDEIKSAKIIKAKAGTSFTLTGHPDGNFDQGRTEVRILRNILSPIVIPSFDKSYQDAYVRVTHWGKAIDGKISFGYIGGAK